MFNLCLDGSPGEKKGDGRERRLLHRRRSWNHRGTEDIVFRHEKKLPYIWPSANGGKIPSMKEEVRRVAQRVAEKKKGQKSDRFVKAP